ncbi:MAG: hypothetical protein AAGB93_01480 [Planctomycetota bacterium]
MDFRRRGRFSVALRWTLAVLVLLLAGGTAFVFWTLSRWDADIEREVAAIEASGAPLGPQDLSLAPAAGPTWWSSMPSWEGPAIEAALWEPEDLDELLQRPDDELAPYGRDLLERLRALYAERAGDRLAVSELRLLLREKGPPSPPNDGPPPEAEALAARIQDAASDALVRLAEGACDGPGFDGKGWVDAWLASDEPLPSPGPFVVPLEVQSAVGRRAWLAAYDGDAERALRHLRLGFCAAHGFEAAPGAVHALVWSLQTERATKALLGVAALLPDADLSEFDAALERVDARARAVRALEEERTIGYAVLERGLDPGGEGGWLSPVKSFLVKLFDRNDTRVFLRTHAALLAAARGPIGEAQDAVERTMRDLSDETFALRSQLMVPHAASLLSVAADLEARTTLARAVLLARSVNAPAALEWITARMDPFADRPYRAEIDADGVLRAWSVGRNRVDDGGDGSENELNGVLDIVVFVRPPG